MLGCRASPCLEACLAGTFAFASRGGPACLWRGCISGSPRLARSQPSRADLIRRDPMIGNRGHLSSPPWEPAQTQALARWPARTCVVYEDRRAAPQPREDSGRSRPDSATSRGKVKCPAQRGVTDRGRISSKASGCCFALILAYGASSRHASLCGAVMSLSLLASHTSSIRKVGQSGKRPRGKVAFRRAGRRDGMTPPLLLSHEPIGTG